MREFLLSLSPTTRAAQLKKPTLIIHAGQGPARAGQPGAGAAQGAQGQQAPVWYVEFTEANHDNLAGVGGDYLLASWMWFFKNFLLN